MPLALDQHGRVDDRTEKGLHARHALQPVEGRLDGIPHGDVSLHQLSHDSLECATVLPVHLHSSLV